MYIWNIICIIYIVSVKITGHNYLETQCTVILMSHKVAPKNEANIEWTPFFNRVSQNFIAEPFGLIGTEYWTLVIFFLLDYPVSLCQRFGDP